MGFFMGGFCNVALGGLEKGVGTGLGKGRGVVGEGVWGGVGEGLASYTSKTPFEKPPLTYLRQKIRQQFDGIFHGDFHALKWPESRNATMICDAIRIHNPKSLAMRNLFFSQAMRTPLRWISIHEKRATKAPAEILRCWPAMREIGMLLRSSDAKGLRFGLALRFGLRCEHPRCQIAGDVGRAKRTTQSMPSLLHWFEPGVPA